MMNYDISKMSNTMILDEIDRIMEAGEDMDAEAISYLLGILQERAPVMIDFDAEHFLEETFQKLDQRINLIQTDSIQNITNQE